MMNINFSPGLLIIMSTSNQQNIFSYRKRTNQDAVSKMTPIRRMQQKQIEQKIKSESEIEKQKFARYMQKHYAIFDNKINRCKLKCMRSATGYAENKKCYTSCEAGLQTFKRFVNNNITQMQQLLNECVANAKELDDMLYETYYCYDIYNKGFDHLRKIIREESLYYE